MNFERSILVTAVATALLVGFVPAAEAAVLDRAGIYASYWKATLDGDARIDGSTPGTPYDLEEVAGVDDDDGIKEIGAWFHPIGRHRLRFSAIDGSFEGSAILATPLDLGGTILPPATPVASAVDLRLFKGVYSYSFVNLDIVNVAGLIGVDYLDAENRLGASGQVYTSSLTGGVPILGVTAQVSPVGFFRAYAEATYANWEVGGLDASIRDIAVRAEFYVAHSFGLGAGYRDLLLEVRDEAEGWLDTRTKGYQVFLLFRF